MKNKFSLFVLLVVVMVISFAGCKSTAGVSWQNEGRFGQHYIVTAKDWEAVQLVFTEVEFEVTNKAKINGEVFTYQALLKEAQRLNADAIINVTIDKRVDSVTYGMTSNMHQVWYGSALAIKFTDTLISTTETNTRRETEKGIENEARTVVNAVLHTTGTTASTGGAVTVEDPLPRRGLFGRRK